MLGVRYARVNNRFNMGCMYGSRKILNRRVCCMSKSSQGSYDSDFLRTNVMADYLDKLSTDANYIAYTEDLEENPMQYIQACVVIWILVYMYFANWGDKRDV